MGSLNIYQDIFPTLGMYSGLKACHEKNNLPFDINTEIETIQKQINYDINHLSDGLIKEGANKWGNSSRLTQSFHFFMFEPIFSPVNALNQPI